MGEGSVSSFVWSLPLKLMKIKKRVLQCSQLDGKFPIEIPSETDPEKIYTVWVDAWANRSELHHCHCGSFKYKGNCKHQKIAHMMICGWNEIEAGENLEARETLKCPNCGNKASWAIWEINEEINSDES
jgi:transcription elongation factor Elf1